MNNIDIIIPCAGNGQRFLEAGYELPKPMIDVLGKPMIQRVIENLDVDGKYHFIVQKEHQKKYGISDLLKSLKKDCNIIEVEQKTDGAACSVLLAEKYLNADSELIITNCDQIFEWDKNKFLELSKFYDGMLLCHEDKNTKWSYCIGDIENDVMNVNSIVEKPKEIPNHSYANVGFYYWKKSSRFCQDAKNMIASNERVNGEFYIAPVYNKLISSDSKNVAATLCKKMWGIGTPEDLKKYELEFNLD
jgi:dTDP-glucose pyrophosphorylase